MTGNFLASEHSIIATDELEKYFYALTTQIGAVPPHCESGLSVGVEVFTLSEGLGMSPSFLNVLWRHSVRTGYLAALIAIDRQVERSLAWQAFVGGLLHDVGMLIFLTHQPQVFMAVVELAQSRGQELGEIERSFLGSTHAESGAKFLARWGVPLEIQEMVAYHDQPFQAPSSGFSPLTAVYIANVLEGGGMAQDGDGVVEKDGETYLRQLGVWDELPYWQSWAREMSLLPV